MELRKSKIAVLVGTRPEAIKLSPVILALRQQPDRFDTVVCSTGQHREMLEQALADFGVIPDTDLKLMTAGQTLPGLSASAMVAVTAFLEDSRPDVVLVQGDTTTAMIAAMAAFYAGIPVGHVEAGLRTGDRSQPFPEEINRRLITPIATWNYAPTQTAVNALLREGVMADSILLTGNTVIDALFYISERVGGPPSELGSRYILVTAHRRENHGERFNQLCLGLRDLVHRNPDLEIVYPVHLNPKVRETVYPLLGQETRIHLTDPVSYRTLVSLMKGCHLVLTDSGGIQEEAPALGKPSACAARGDRAT